jgi:hypothetical protein
MIAAPPTSSVPCVSVSRVGGGNAALHLAREGWVCRAGFIDEDTVPRLRDELEAAFASPELRSRVLSPPGCGGILPDLLQLPGIHPHVFVPRLAPVLRELIGPGFVLLPEHAIHREGFGGWHKDTDMFEHAGRMAHWDADFGVWQCAIYLQDNSPLHGGGLSVVSGSHRVPRPDPRAPDSAQRFLEQAEALGRPLPSRAGDLVVFHTRLDHRATPRLESPPDGAKLAIFFLVAHDDAHAAAWSAFIRNRPDYTYLRTYAVPQAMHAMARSNGFRFAD